MDGERQPQVFHRKGDHPQGVSQHNIKINFGASDRANHTLVNICDPASDVSKFIEDVHQGANVLLDGLQEDGVGERCMGNKKFPTLTKIDLEDEQLREERLHLHTLVDR